MKSISKVNLTSWLVTILLLSISFMAFFVYDRYFEFKSKKAFLEANSFRSSDRILKTILNNSSALFDYYMRVEKRSDPLGAFEDFRRTIVDESSVVELFIIDDKGILFSRKITELEIETGQSVFNFRDDSGNRPFFEACSDTGPTGNAERSFIYTFSGRDLPQKYSLYMIERNAYGSKYFVGGVVNVTRTERLAAVYMSRLKTDLILELFTILIFAAAVTVIALRFSFGINARIRDELALIVDYLDSSSKQDVELDCGKIKFKELNIIANAASTMTKEIKSLLSKVKDLAMQSELRHQQKKGMLSMVSRITAENLSELTGIVSLMKDTKLSAEQAGYVRALELSMKSLGGVIENIRLSETEKKTGKEAAKINFSLKELFSDAEKQYAHHAEDKEHSFKTTVSNKLPDTVSGDYKTVRQIVANLFESAVNSTAASSLITVDAVRDNSDGPDGDDIRMAVKVGDILTGYNPNDIHLLMKFPHPDRHYASVSLCLSVCKILAEGIGGSLEIEPSGASSFRIVLKLPLHAEVKAEPKTSEAEAQKVSPRLDKATIRILLAEDDVINRNIVTKTLNKLGYTAVDAVRNGVEAFEKYSMNNYEIILLDCEMPLMDGFTVARKIRDAEEAAGKTRIPIIATTGYVMEGDREKCLAAGMDDYLPKPIPANLLDAKIIEYHLKNISKGEGAK